MAFTENLDDFFDLDDFAVECEINTSPRRTISVLMSTPTEEVTLYEGAVEAGAKFFKAKTADIDGVRDGHKATIGGTVYTIRTIAEDGHGTSRLYLK
ncbi:MAG TPA: hypothetical protein PLX39_17275 [Pyrinomonadaceae bacterium]|nr:hypothetical protein [Pyrinomonadaceae bacterium]